MKRFYKARVKIPTPERLANIALHYLSRFAASEASLRRVLDNRIRRAAMRDEAFAADHEAHGKLREAIEAIEAIIEKHRRTGALNDAAYAEMKTGSLRRAGRSRRAIERALTVKGVGRDMIADAIAHDDEERGGEAELAAAVKLARRRRIGPYRAEPAGEAQRRKDIAVLARAGFSLDIARKVLGGDMIEED